MRIAITGASGYIGSCLARRALQDGHDLVALTRRPMSDPRIAWAPFDLHRPADVEIPHADVLVHLAAITTAPSEEAAEQAAAAALVAAAQRLRARFIFVSSQTARPDAPTAYGRTKWRIEQDVCSHGGTVVRPGQVYGGPPRALFGTLVSTVRQLPCIPAFLPAPRIQPVHVEDLVLGLLAAASRDDLGGRVLQIAAPQGISFTRFLQSIARHRLGVLRPRFPVPVICVQVACKLAGRRLHGLQRLLSLFALQPMQTGPDLQQLRLTLRPLDRGMQKSRRRGLIAESKALLSYILRSPPAGEVLRRHVRCVEALRTGQALRLPGLVMRFPCFFALLDVASSTKAGGAGHELAWRIEAAVSLAEASPQGARRFLGPGAPGNMGRRPLVAAWRLLCAMLAEAGWRIAALLLRPLLRIALRRSEQV